MPCHQGHDKQVIAKGKEEKRRIENAHDKWAEVADVEKEMEQTAKYLLQAYSSFCLESDSLMRRPVRAKVALISFGSKERS